MHLVVSKQLKALILTKDISEQGIVVRQPDCLTLQHFNYQCSRRRTDDGIPYGPTVPSYIDFTVRVTDKAQGKAFFERVGLNKSFRYSFLFNASFASKKKLSDYEDAMVITGYLVEMEEFYDQPRNPEEYSEQLLLHCRLLLCSIDYQGSKDSLTLTITED